MVPVWRSWTASTGWCPSSCRRSSRPPSRRSGGQFNWISTDCSTGFSTERLAIQSVMYSVENPVEPSCWNSIALSPWCELSCLLAILLIAVSQPHEFLHPVDRIAGVERGVYFLPAHRAGWKTCDGLWVTLSGLFRISLLWVLWVTLWGCKDNLDGIMGNLEGFMSNLARSLWISLKLYG